MSDKITATEWIDFGFYGIVAYKIETTTDRGIKMQRHTWKYADGSIEVEDWIRSY